MFTEAMNKSLDSNKRFVENMSEKDLNGLMEEFDNYEIERCDCGFYNHESLHEFLSKFYKNTKSTELFTRKRRSVDVKENKKEEDLNKVLFLYIYCN